MYSQQLQVSIVFSSVFESLIVDALDSKIFTCSYLLLNWGKNDEEDFRFSYLTTFNCL